MGDEVKPTHVIVLAALLFSSSAFAASTGGPVTIQSSQYPFNSTPLTASNTGTTAAVVVSLAATASVTNYLCSFQIDADATAAVDGVATITGIIGGTMTIGQSVSAVASGKASRWHDFSPCLPASAPNVAITLTTIAAGAGGNTAANLAGYRQ